LGLSLLLLGGVLLVLVLVPLNTFCRCFCCCCCCEEEVVVDDEVVDDDDDDDAAAAAAAAGAIAIEGRASTRRTPMSRSTDEAGCLAVNWPPRRR
jgi:hypothetical protein